MDSYYLKINIIEFIYKSNKSNINVQKELNKISRKKENKEIDYEIDFKLKKSKEKYTLIIINDNKGEKKLNLDSFTLMTFINIKKESKDYLEISIYKKELNKRILIDKEQEEIIDENCIKVKKYSIINIGNFIIKFSYKLEKSEDNKNKVNNNELICKTEEEDILSKFHETNKNKKNIDDIIYDENIYQEIKTVNKDNNCLDDNNNIKNEMNHKMNSSDFFDINVDIFEEEEKEEEENNSEKEEKNPFELAEKMTLKKIYRNTHMSTYENIKLEQPILKEIIKDNLIECFIVSGLALNKKVINNSETYIPQCKHKNCEFNTSYNSQIFFRLQKPNSIFEEIDSNLISNLIFPNGIKICFGHNFFNNLVKKRNSLQFKHSNFSFNVLTDIKGNKYYIYSIIFFIKFEFNEFIEFYEEYQDIKDINTNNNIFIPFSFSLISKNFNIEKFNIILKDLYTTFNSNEMRSELFDNELIHLIYEIPNPPINSKIKIFLPNYQVEICSNIYENKNYRNINIFDILFRKYSYNINFIIKIFIIILLEKRIIFRSSKYNKIYLTIESILTLLYPFKWIGTYIPLIPNENINLILQSFLPFIIGMTHSMFFNYSNKVENINKDNNLDNIFIINLDTENITPIEKMKEIIDICPIIDFIENEYIKNGNMGELNNEKIKKIFFDSIFILIGDFEKFTSKLGENILFNQKIFLNNRTKKYEKFYKEITSTQQFYYFINEIYNNNDNLYYEEFKENIKNKKRIKLIKKNKKEKIEEIYLDDYILYPYFFQKNKELELDLFNFEDETDLYYNCLDIEHEINYLLNTEAFIRIKLILKNYIPENLRKYEINKEKNKDKKKDLYNNNYDSNISLTEYDSYKFDNIKNIFDNFYGKVKKSINKIIPRKTMINNNVNENKENIDNNIQINNKSVKIEYRHRNSLIKMIKENTNKKELLKYKEQIIDLLRDYMGYILSNQNKDNIFTLNELSKLLKYRRIRRELSKIIYQKKFEKNIEHELSEETFELLYQSIFFALNNLNDNKNEYKTLKRIIQSLFYYFHKRKKGMGKIYLYQKFIENNDKFFFKRNSEFWEYYYKMEKIENEENNDYNYDENGLINKIKNQMFLLDVDEKVFNIFE